MDIIEFAMQMELDGKDFYERSADGVDSPELKKVLQYLAEEEERHYLFFKRLAGGDTASAQKELGRKNAGAVLVKNVFVQLMDSDKGHSFGADVRSVWKEAMSIEVSAERLYREEAKKEKDADRKALLSRIADEEQSHVYLIDNMLSFMTDPQSFVASKQYSDFKSWEGR